MESNFDTKLANFRERLERHTREIAALREVCPHVKILSYRPSYAMRARDIPHTEQRICAACGMKEEIYHPGKRDRRRIIDELCGKTLFPRAKYGPFADIDEKEFLSILARFAPPIPDITP